MGLEHETCQEHSGLTTQIKTVCAEMRNNTKAVNSLCVEIRGLAVKNEQFERDIKNLGTFKAEKTEVSTVKKDVGLLQKILYGTLGTGIVVGVVLAWMKR